MWRRIKDFDGYFINKSGVVKSINRIKIRSNNTVMTVNSKIITPRIGDRGYYTVNLFNNEGKRKTLYIHRLLMIAFNYTKDYKEMTVNHIDRNTLNNDLSNLEWCTIKENIQYSFMNNPNRKVSTKGKFGGDHPKARKVGKYDLNGNIISEFNSVSEAANYNKSLMSGIYSCCLGKQKTVHGFIWKYI